MDSAGERSLEPFNVVIAGGGVAALETAFALRALAGESARMTLVAPDSEFVYRPMACLLYTSHRSPIRTGRRFRTAARTGGRRRRIWLRGRLSHRLGPTGHAGHLFYRQNSPK